MRTARGAAKWEPENRLPPRWKVPSDDDHPPKLPAASSITTPSPYPAARRPLHPPPSSILPSHSLRPEAPTARIPAINPIGLLGFTWIWLDLLGFPNLSLASPKRRHPQTKARIFILRAAPSSFVILVWPPLHHGRLAKPRLSFPLATRGGSR